MKYLALVLIMALVRIPTLDSRGDTDTGVAPIEAYVDTSTGQIMNRVRQGNSESGFTYAFQPTGQTWEFANKAGAGGQMIYGSQGYTPPTFQDQGDGSFNSMGAGGDTANGMHQIGDDPKLAQWLTAHGAAPQYDPNYGFVVSSKDWSKLGPDYRNSIYTGSADPITSFLNAGGGVGALMAGVGGLAFSGAGLGGLSTAGDAYMPAALGADGLGSVGAAGSGLAGDAYMPAALGSNGTGSLGGLTSSAAPTSVAGTSNVAGDAYLPGSLPSGAGDAYMPGALNGSTSNLSGLTGNVPGDAYMPGALNGGSPSMPSMPYQPPIPNNNGSMPTEINPSTYTGPSSSLPNIPTGAKSVLDKIMNGTATASDYAKLAASGVDIAAALASYNRQNQLWDSGADSRARFNQGMTNPSSVMSLFQPAVDQATDSYLRGISAKSGNPATLGSAPAETSKYVFGSTMVPLWNSYEGLNANVGWNGASTKSADAAQGLASATGQAAGTLTNPNSDMTTTLANLKNLGLLPDASKAGSYISSLFGNPA